MKGCLKNKMNESTINLIGGGIAFLAFVLSWLYILYGKAFAEDDTIQKGEDDG